MIKSSGIIRRIDDLHRLCITKGVCSQYNIVEGDAIEIIPTDEGILLRKYDAKVSKIVESAKSMFLEKDKFAVKENEDEINKAFIHLIDLLRKIGE